MPKSECPQHTHFGFFLQVLSCPLTVLLLPACFGKGMEMSITFCCLVADGGWVWCWPLCWVQWYRQGRFTIGSVRAKAAITQLTFCLHQAGVSCVFAMLKTQAVAVDYASVFLNLKTGFWCTLLLDVFLSFICILVWKLEKKMYKLVASGNRFTPIFPIILLCLWNRYYSSTSIWPFYVWVHHFLQMRYLLKLTYNIVPVQAFPYAPKGNATV